MLMLLWPPLMVNLRILGLKSYLATHNELRASWLMPAPNLKMGGSKCSVIFNTYNLIWFLEL